MDHVCPSCGFAGASIRDDGARQCRQCHGVYSTPVVYPDPPTPGQWSELGGRGKNGAPAAAFVGFAILVVASGTIFFAIGGGGESRESSPASAGESSDGGTGTTARPEEPARPAAEVTYQGASGLNGTKRWWILGYRNTGNVTLSHPQVRVTLRDEDGQVLETEIAKARVFTLPAGETVWMRAEMNNPPEGEASFEPIEVEAARGNVTTLSIEARDVMLDPRDSESLRQYPFVTGRIDNVEDERLRVILVVVTGHDEAGNVVDMGEGVASPMIVRPGESSEFRVMTGVYRDGKAVRWSARAWALDMP